MERMSGWTLTTEFKFCAAHRIRGHRKCANLHGHNYRVELDFWLDRLDDMGMVMDFDTIKDRVGRWITVNWDHKTILEDGDPLVHAIHSIPAQVVYQIKGPPTAEIMAAFLCGQCNAKLFKDDPVQCTAARVWETDRLCAEYRGKVAADD